MTTPAVESDYAWLRSSPTDLPRDTPGSFRAMITAKSPLWNQTYMEWLVGATNGTANADQVLAEFNTGDGAAVDVDTLKRWLASLFADPAKKSSFEEWDIAPGVKIPKFETSFPAFAAEINAIRKATDSRIKDIQEKAKAGGTKVSPAQARKQAGRECQRIAMANAAETRGRALDINVGLVLLTQIEQYKVTGLQMYLDAYAQLDSIPWDSSLTQGTEDGDDAGGAKEEAIAVLRAAGTAVLNAAAKLKNSSAILTTMQPGDKVTPVHEAAYDDMFEALLDFAEAIVQQGRAITKAGKLVEKWARQSTRAFIKENFDTVYPRLGAALLLMRSSVSVTVAVLAFFPPLDVAGPALELADEAIEAAITQLVAWRAAGGKDVQAEYVGQEFVVNKAELSALGKGIVTANKINEGIEWLDDNTIGRIGDGIRAGAKKLTGALADGAGAPGSIRKDAVKLAGDAADKLFDKRSDVIKKLAKKELPLDTMSLLETGATQGVSMLGKSMAKAAPFVGTAFTVAQIGLDVVAYGANQYKEMQTKAGLTEEDVQSLRKLIVDGAGNNPYHSMFESGDVALEPKAAGDPHVYARIGGVRMRIVLGDNPRVDNADEKQVAKSMLPSARNDTPNPVEYLHRNYLLDWGGATLAEQAHPKYGFRVPAKVTINGTAFDVTCLLDYDVMAQDSTVTAVLGTIPGDDVLDKLGNKGPITAADLKERFGGQQVDFGGELYTVDANAVPTEVKQNPLADEVTFTAKARHAKSRRSGTLSLRFGLDSGLEVLAADLPPDPLAPDELKKKPATTDSVVNRFSGMQVEYAWDGGTTTYVLGEKCTTVLPQSGGLRFDINSIGNQKLSLLYTDGHIDVLEVSPHPQTEARRRQLVSTKARNVNLLNPTAAFTTGGTK